MLRRETLKLAGGIVAGFAGAAGSIQAAQAADPVNLSWPPTCNPRIGEWHLADESVYENRNWTTRWQGITRSHRHYYLTNNTDDGPWGTASYEGIWRMPHDWPGASGIVMVAKSPYAKGSTHPGSPTYDPFRRQLYVPVEGPGHIWRLQVNADGSLTTIETGGYLGGSGPGGSPQGEWQIPFLAFNPRDKLLYSCRYDQAGGVQKLYAYDPLRKYRLVKTFTFPYKLNKIQGGVFSDNGNFYITSEHTKEIGAYNVHATELKMWHWGNYRFNWDDLELEGITMGPPLDYAQTGPNRIHVGALDIDDNLSTDDLYLKHMAVPNPRVV
ncbi:hypothetical protein [Streptomyces sp. NPDC057675]|uniref:hypothetical protein n=1 Tax=Streptomyces sp. NPDC057675 TaxID=3346204 RepID=UPI003694D4F9